MQLTSSMFAHAGPSRASVDEGKIHPAFRHASIDAESSSIAPSWVERLSYVGSDDDDEESRSETSTIRGNDAEESQTTAQPLSVSRLTEADRATALSLLTAAKFSADRLDRDRNKAILWAAETGSALCVAYCLDRWEERAPSRRFSISVPKAVTANLSSREMGLAFTRNEHKLDPIHLAARNGHADVVDILIREGGVPVDSDSEIWGTPLHMAAQHGRRQVVRMLLDAGADINRLTVTRNQSPLQLAAETGNNAIVKILLDRGALINHGRNHGALHCAAELGNRRLALMLLEHGANVNALNNSRRTALHLAAREGHSQIAALLVVRDAILDLRDDARGMSPLDHAVRNGREDVVQLLLERGVDPTSRDAMGWTPLHLAAQGGHTALVAILLDHGVPLDVKTGRNRTALQLATTEGNTDTVRYLRQRATSAGVNQTAEDSESMVGLMEHGIWARSQSTSVASSRLALDQDAASMRSSRAVSLY